MIGKDFVVASRRVAFASLLLGAVISAAGCDSFAETSAQEHLQNAQSYLDEGDFQAAQIELRNALQKDGSLAEARRALGELRLRGGDAAGAAKEFERAVESGVSEAEIAPNYAEALLYSGEPAAALDLIERVGIADADAAAARMHTIRGFALRTTGEQEEGCAAFDAALERDAELAAAGIGAAECTALQGRLTQAVSGVEEVLAREPENARALELLAQLETARGRRDAAEDAYQRLLDAGGRELVARLGLARMRLAAGDVEGARPHIDRALNLNSGAPAGHFLRGLANFREERLDDAAVNFQETLNRAPEHLGATFFLGATHYLQGNDERAVRLLRAVVRQRPNLEQAAQLLAASEQRLEAADDAGSSTLTLGTADLVDSTLGADGDSLESAEVGDAGPASEDAGGSAQGLEEAEQAAATGGEDPLAALGGEVESASAAIREVAQHLRDREFDAAHERLDALLEAAPENARLHALKGLTYYLEGDDLEAARSAFETALEHDSDLLGAHHGLAVLAAREGDTDRARAHYDAALEASPDNLGTELALFDLARRSGDVESAERWLRQAAQNHPESPVAAGLYGMMLLEQDAPEQAQVVAERALEANPRNAGLHILRGDALAAQERLDEAVLSYEAAAASAPESVRAHGKLAFAHARRGDVGATRTALEAALDVAPEQPAVLVPLARLESRVGNHERALALADRLAALENASEPELALARAEVLARADHTEDALAALRTAREANPDSAPVTVSLVRLEWAAGNRDASVGILESWVERNPEDSGAWRILGDQRLQLGGREQALGAYREAVAANPENWQALNNLASLLGESAGEDALAYAERAHQLAPESPHVQDTLGWLLLQTGQPERALELLDRAAEALAQNPTVRYHHAAALAENGQTEQAVELLEGLIDEGTSFAEREQATSLLADLRPGGNS